MVLSMRTLSRRRIVLGLVTAAFSAMFLLGSLMRHYGRSTPVETTAIEITRSLHSTNRKLLGQAEEPNRIGERCTTADIEVYQAATEPLRNGIPTYSVEIINSCATGCSISGIHFSCGWFSSARMVNPKVFKRLRYDDCLVNDGKPLSFGATLSFQYATTFSYPLSVSSVTCH